MYVYYYTYTEEGKGLWDVGEGYTFPQWEDTPSLQLRRLGGRGSVRGSRCGEPARLRFTSLRPPSYGDSAGPSCCVPLKSYVMGYPGERISYGSGVRLPG